LFGEFDVVHDQELVEEVVFKALNVGLNMRVKEGTRE
jgi:hypothetical protein